MTKGILLFFRYLPEVISFLKWISKQVDEGIEEYKIRRNVKKIHAAFDNPNREDAARELNDIIRGA